MPGSTRTVTFTGTAERELRRIEKDSEYEKVLEDILDLGDDPFPIESKDLEGRATRLRSARTNDGRYRIVYLLGRDRILIVRVRPRGIAYRGY